MKQNLPTRRMRHNPDLEQIKRQAKELLSGFRRGDAEAMATVQAHYDDADLQRFALHDAQLVTARSYGFASWPKLKAFVEGVKIGELVRAVQAGDLSLVKKMIQARPELANATVSYGDEHRAIHYAVMCRHPEIVRLLMQNGADARAGIHPHRGATSAWTLADERGYEEITAILREEEGRRQVQGRARKEDAASVSGEDRLRQAVAAGDMAWLRAAQADGRLTPDVRWDGGGLLTVAVQHDRMEVLQYLLDQGFDPEERVAAGEGDWTAYSQGYPLWHCAALGRKAMAQMLLERGANPNVHVDSSGSPVYSAYSHQQWEMVELLQRNGGIVTHDIAALYRQTELVRRIFEDEDAGLLPAAAKPPGKTLAEEVLRFAADGGAVEIVELALGRVGWARDDSRWLSILSSPLCFWHHIPWLYAGNKAFDRTGYLECFRLILHACDGNVTGGFGRSILHEIAAMGDWISDAEVAAFGRAALDAGTRMDHRDDILKSTPLGWACRWGRTELVELLVSRGADVDEDDAEPWARPRAWALKMGRDPILALLGASS